MSKWTSFLGGLGGGLAQGATAGYLRQHERKRDLEDFEKQTEIQSNAALATKRTEASEQALFESALASWDRSVLEGLPPEWGQRYDAKKREVEQAANEEFGVLNQELTGLIGISARQQTKADRDRAVELHREIGTLAQTVPPDTGTKAKISNSYTIWTEELKGWRASEEAFTTQKGLHKELLAGIEHDNFLSDDEQDIYVKGKVAELGITVEEAEALWATNQPAFNKLHSQARVTNVLAAYKNNPAALEAYLKTDEGTEFARHLDPVVLDGLQTFAASRSSEEQDMIDAILNGKSQGVLEMIDGGNVDFPEIRQMAFNVYTSELDTDARTDAARRKEGMAMALFSELLRGDPSTAVKQLGQQASSLDEVNSLLSRAMAPNGAEDEIALRESTRRSLALNRLGRGPEGEQAGALRIAEALTGITEQYGQAAWGINQKIKNEFANQGYTDVLAQNPHLLKTGESLSGGSAGLPGMAETTYLPVKPSTPLQVQGTATPQSRFEPGAPPEMTPSPGAAPPLPPEVPFPDLPQRSPEIPGASTQQRRPPPGLIPQVDPQEENMDAILGQGESLEDDEFINALPAPPTSKSGQGGTLPQRANNPGALSQGGIGDKYAKQDKNGKPVTMKSKDGTQLLVFEDYRDGYRAMRDDLEAKVSGNSRVLGGDPNLAALAAVWAPAQPNWIKNVLDELGAEKTDKVSDYPLDEVMAAIAKAEGFLASPRRMATGPTGPR